MNQAVKKPAAKNPVAKATKKPLAIKSERVLSSAEVTADIQTFGSELRADRQKSISFLQRAGIITGTGKLTKAYR
jgi:hypothetical protein